MFLGPTIDPLLGGFIIKIIGWRWNFWIVLKAAAPITLLLILLTKETSDKAIIHRETLLCVVSPVYHRLEAAMILLAHKPFSTAWSDRWCNESAQLSW